MRAGKLRFRANVERLIAGSWQPYFSGWFNFRGTSEGEERRSYAATTRWRSEWDTIAGLARLDKGFRIVWAYGVKDGQALLRYLIIDEVLDADSRRREVEFACHEIRE
jgi:hypothetical protein